MLEENVKEESASKKKKKQWKSCVWFQMEAGGRGLDREGGGWGGERESDAMGVREERWVGGAAERSCSVFTESYRASSLFVLTFLFSLQILRPNSDPSNRREPTIASFQPYASEP
ncbi:hypothetical protein PIB30_050316 [Stylosanthes scabra]|uniref:Uncharacterized protein n=1 Tax=Stylosanthes scabra TaxID=79078 RepID=A0ABU6RI78_9FABA|nr:hypothetical protein [Stylosanthes scabra]